MESAFRNTRTYILLAFVVLALCLGAFAQGSGELAGLVTDTTGAVVAGVGVKLTNSATGEVRTTVTTPSGIYNFPALPIVGTYTLEIAAKGFKSSKVQNIIVSVGTTTTRDVKLEVGATTEQVTVEAGQQIVETEDSALSTLVDRRVWENMPIEARNSNDFVNLVAGVVPENQAGGTYRGAAVNGVRTGGGNFMVEGVDNNEQGQGGVAICGTACGQGGSNTSISPDAIEEYRVITHDFSAEYGKVGGFVTDTVLKSGTNKWHGSLFEYNRIQALAAEDWFTNAAAPIDGVALKDHLVRNQFGGSFGGPIIKDKTFFYTSFEEHRLRQSTPLQAPTVTQQFLDFLTSGGLKDFMNSQWFCGGEGDGGAAASKAGSIFQRRQTMLGTRKNGVRPQQYGGGCDIPTSLGPIFSKEQQKFPNAVPVVNSSLTCPNAGTIPDSPDNCSSFDAWGWNGATQTPDYPVPLLDNVTQSNSTPLNQYRFSLKFDHNFSSKDRLSATYLLENVSAQYPFGGGVNTFGVPENNPNRAQTLGVTWTHTISPTVLNQFKIGYVRHTSDAIPQGIGTPEIFAIDGSGGGLGAYDGLPQYFTENEFQYKDDISITHGKHQLKFGGEYRRTRNGSLFTLDSSGTFASWGTESMITDGLFTDAIEQYYFTPAYAHYGYGGWYYASASVVPATGQIPDYYRGYRANEAAAYAQDDWRVNSKLTVNLGLRWEYFGPPHNFQPNIDSNVYFGNGLTPLPCPSPCNQFFPANSQWYAYEATAVFQVHNSSIWNKDLKNFGPRVGFAYDLLGNQKLVVRAGFGMFYDRLYNNIFENIRFNAPYFADEVSGVARNGVAMSPSLQPGLFDDPFTNNASFISTTVFPNGLPKPVPRHMDQNMTTPYYMQESFGLQYALAKDFALEASYVGTLGRKLLGIENRNTFDGRTSGAGSAARPNPIFGSDNARGNYFGSNYNALDLTLRKRFSRGLSLTGSYTYSKALDEISDVFRTTNGGTAFGNEAATDQQNVRNDYGPSDFDLRHRIVVSFDYDLPIFRGNRMLGGWTMNSIISWNTGAPIGMFDSSSDANANGVRSDRPEFVGTGSVLDAIHQHGNVYLDPTQFKQSTKCLLNPALDTHGGYWCDPNLGRGALPGPHFANMDFGVSKAFKISESMGFRFDANFFDIFNHPNFSTPQGNVGSPSNFGTSTSTVLGSGHRVTQLALRFDF